MPGVTLTEFLTARFDEDAFWGAEFGCNDDHDGLELNPSCADRVLAEVDAKRQIMAWCSQRDRIYIGTLASNPDAPRPEDFVEGDFSRAVDAVILRYLALPYADHPDYDEAWRP